MTRLVQKTPNLYLVYVDDVENDWMSVATEFGMVRDGEPLHSTTIERSFKFTNEYGVAMDGVRITGRTVNMLVTAAAVHGHVGNSADLVAMLNRFPNCTLKLGGASFFGKFNPGSPAVHMVRDRKGNSFRVGVEGYPDTEAAMGLAMRLSEDNGDMFRPVIARFVYAARELPRTMKAVGYFDLKSYLQLIRSGMSGLFIDSTRTDAALALALPSTGNLGVRIISSVGGQADIEIFGHTGVMDTSGAKNFRPMVILSLEPLRIREMKFPIQKVVFDKTTVFMTPIMSMTGAWESLQGGIDLLAPPGKPK